MVMLELMLMGMKVCMVGMVMVTEMRREALVWNGTRVEHG
jgi:hypothetical protein